MPGMPVQSLTPASDQESFFLFAFAPSKLDYRYAKLPLVNNFYFCGHVLERFSSSSSHMFFLYIFLFLLFSLCFFGFAPSGEDSRAEGGEPGRSFSI